MSNLRNIASGARFYTADNDDLVPHHTNWATPVDKFEQWSAMPPEHSWGSISPYLGYEAEYPNRPGILTCPDLDDAIGNEAMDYGNPLTYTVNFFTTNRFVDDNSKTILLTNTTLTKISSWHKNGGIAEMAWFMDGWIRSWDTPIFYMWASEPHVWIDIYDKCSPYPGRGFFHPHSEKQNIVYVDGHCGSVDKDWFMSQTDLTDAFWRGY